MKKNFIKTAMVFCLGCIFGNNYSQVTVTLDPDTEYQVIEGFGAHGAMNVWWSGGPFYNQGFLDLIVDDLGMTINRNEYYPDGQDFDSKQKGWLTALKNKADASGEPMKFISTYWSPPARWKSNSSTTNGGSLLPQYYDDFADYCVNTANTYKNECNIDLYALSIANEPRFAQFYNSSEWDPDDYAEVVALVGKAFDDEGLDTKTFGVEDMGSYSTNSAWFDAILEDNVESQQYMDIWAVHSYTDGVAPDYGSAPGWEAMYNKPKEHSKQLWMTETSGYSNNWSGGFDLAKSIFLALKYGKVSAWVWWQLSGDHTAGEILIPLGTPGKLYYASKNYYRYIRPGARHIDCTSTDDDLLTIAFKHGTEGRLTLVLINNSGSSKNVNLDMGSYTTPPSFTHYLTSSGLNCADQGNVSGTISLAANSINTLVYEDSEKAPTVDQVENMMLLSTEGEQTINLTGITDGGDGGQNISISATSSDPSVIPNPGINYTSPGGTGTLNFTPVSGASGTVTITVTMQDNGSDVANLNVHTMDFDVKVIPFVNAAPVIDPVNNITVDLKDGTGSAELTGVGDGNDGSQTISIEAESSNKSVCDVAAIYAGGNTMELFYQPHTTGTISVTLTLTDDGKTYYDGTDSYTTNFSLQVTDVPDNPDTTTTLIQDESVSISAYPNPANEFLNISIPGAKIYSGFVVSISGEKVMEFIGQDEKSKKIDISHLKTGMYMIVLHDNENSYKASFLKQ